MKPKGPRFDREAVEAEQAVPKKLMWHLTHQLYRQVMADTGAKRKANVLDGTGKPHRDGCECHTHLHSCTLSWREKAPRKTRGQEQVKQLN